MPCASTPGVTDAPRRGRGRPPKAKTPATSCATGVVAKRSRCYEKDYCDLRAQVATLNQQVKCLKNELNNERKLRQTMLKGDLRSLQVDYDELLIKFDSMESEYKLMRRLRNESRAIASRLQAEVDAAKTKLNEERANHETELQKVRSKLEKVLTMTEKMRSTHMTDKEKMRLAFAERKRSLNSEKKETVEGLQQQVQSLQAKNAELEADVAALRWKLAADARSGAVSQRHASRKRDEAIEEASKTKNLALMQLSQAEERIATAELRANEAEDRALEAGQRASQEEASAASMLTALEECQRSVQQAEKAEKQAKQQAQQLRLKAETLAQKLQALPSVPIARTVDEWAALSRESRYKAAERERKCLLSFLMMEDHSWRAADIATVLQELDLLHDVILHTKEGFRIFFGEVSALMKQLENDEFGREFGLLLHFDMHLIIPKILRLTQAACKVYDSERDAYSSKVLLRDPWRKDQVLYVPRIAPPRHKLEKDFKTIYAQLNVQSAEDGKVAFTSFSSAVKQLMQQDPGSHGMPPLVNFKENGIPVVISFDGTGYGSRQSNTAVIRNPYMSASNQQLRIFGLGNVSDDRDGVARIFGDNIHVINDTICARATGICMEVEGISVRPKIFVATDVAALRHVEHIAGSGWCSCSRDFALRTTPKKPESVEEMHTLLLQCKSPTMEERFTKSHCPMPGEQLPRPCPCCSYGHTSATASAEFESLKSEEERLSSDTSKRGKATYCDWRMKHAATHDNVQPGLYGRPYMHHDLDDQILEPLHYAELNMNKTLFKHGILSHASDDARALIAEQLKEWKHPLDTRRKEDNRRGNQKWFTGERWRTFAAGQRGSPGGPKAIARLVKIIADDLQLRGVDSGSNVASVQQREKAPATSDESPDSLVPNGGRGRNTSGGRGRGRGRQAFNRRLETHAPSSDNALQVWSAQVQHQPTAMERAADPEDLSIIRELFGSRAQTLINTLLAFDAYFKWYYALRSSIPIDAPLAVRESRAFMNCCDAIDLHEITERLTARGLKGHQSFLFHGAIFKVSRDILKVADVWSFDSEPLELQNGETKRVAEAAGARRLTYSGKYSTSTSISVLRNLLATRYLRRGDGVISMRSSRVAQRVFGKESLGRLVLPKKEKLESADDRVSDVDHDPKSDSCLKAFVRLLALYTDE